MVCSVYIYSKDNYKKCVFFDDFVSKISIYGAFARLFFFIKVLLSIYQGISVPILKFLFLTYMCASCLYYR